MEHYSSYSKPSVFISDPDKEAQYNAAEYKNAAYWKTKQNFRKRYMLLLLGTAIVFIFYWKWSSAYWDSNMAIRIIAFIYLISYITLVLGYLLILHRDKRRSRTICSGYYKIRVEFKNDFLYYEFKDINDRKKVFTDSLFSPIQKEIPVHQIKIPYCEIRKIIINKERFFVTVYATGKEWVAKNEWEEISAADFKEKADIIHSVHIPLVFQDNDIFIRQLQNNSNRGVYDICSSAAYIQNPPAKEVNIRL